MTRTTKVGTFYHFTSTAHLPLILEAGYIKTTESNVGSNSPDQKPHGEHVGPDVVWLVDQPELRHDHGLSGSINDKTEVRFTVRCRATRWLDWGPAKQMDPEWQLRFAIIGGGAAAVRRWWVCERPIQRVDWKSVEIRQADGSWKDAT